MTIERIVHCFFSLELYPRSFTAILNSGVKSFYLSRSTCYTFSLSRGYPLFSQISVLGKKKSTGGILPGSPLNTDNYQTLNSPCREDATVKNARQCMKNRRENTGDMPGYIYSAE